jgi:hypothetical protein
MGFVERVACTVERVSNKRRDHAIPGDSFPLRCFLALPFDFVGTLTTFLFSLFSFFFYHAFALFGRLSFFFLLGLRGRFVFSGFFRCSLFGGFFRVLFNQFRY